MSEDTVMVFTGRPPSQLLEEGGTQAWALSAKRARMCKYVVCVQNRETLERFSPTEPHDMAFLIGKITEVSLSEEQPDASEKRPDRYIIKFEEYADIAVDAGDFRKGNRNPVSYHSIYDLGIDPETLPFKMAGSEPEPVRTYDGRPLTIAEAKLGLALMFGVPQENVEIVIRS